MLETFIISALISATIVFFYLRIRQERRREEEEEIIKAANYITNTVRGGDSAETYLSTWRYVHGRRKFLLLQERLFDNNIVVREE